MNTCAGTHAGSLWKENVAACKPKKNKKKNTFKSWWGTCQQKKEKDETICQGRKLAVAQKRKMRDREGTVGKANRRIEKDCWKGEYKEKITHDKHSQPG